MNQLHLNGSYAHSNGQPRFAVGDFRKAASTLASSLAASGPQAAVFASSHAGAGVTTTVLSLSRILRETYGLRVLAVELNSVAPRFEEVLALDGERSLAAVAEGRLTAPKAAQPIDAGFAVIPAGASQATGFADVSALLHKVIAQVASDYDAILADTPPLSISADALAAARAAKRLVLVVEAGRTSTGEVERIRRDVSAVGVELLGAVLNKERRYLPQWLSNLLGR